MQISSLKDSKATWLGYLALLGVITWLCFGDLRHHALGVHDAQTFRDNIEISRDFSFFFSAEKEQKTGRPLAELIKWLGFVCWGNDPAAYHLFVVVLHTLASWLLARLFWRFEIQVEAAYLSGLLFLVNVSHAQTVHHISALDYPLALCCGLLAGLMFKCYLDTPSMTRLWSGYGLLLGGIFSHPSVLALGGVYAYYAWHRGYGLRAWWRHVVPGMLLLGGMLLGLLISPKETTTLIALEAYGSMPVSSLVSRIGDGLLVYLSRLVSTAHWLPMTLHEVHPWEATLGWVVLAGLLGWVVRHAFPTAFWAIWVLISLLPFLVLAPTHDGGTRYLYIPSAGIAGLIAGCIHSGSRGLNARYRPWGFCMAVLVTAGLLGYSHRSLKQVEALSLYYSARYHLHAEERQIGIELLQRALACQSDQVPLDELYWFWLNALLKENGDIEPLLRRAGEHCPTGPRVRALILAFDSLSSDEPRRSQALHHLAGIAQQAYQEEAGDTFRSTMSTVYYNLAHGAYSRGEYSRAVQACRLSLEYVDRLKPLSLLACSLAQIEGRMEEALQVYRYMLDNCDLPEGSSNLFVQVGINLQNQGQVNEAIRAYRRALAFDESHLTARVNLGWNLFLQGDLEAAIVEQRKVLAHQAHSVAQFNLGLFYLVQGQPEAAEAAYARGVARFGCEEAVRIGAVEDLRRVQQTLHHPVGQRILNRYWRSQDPNRYPEELDTP